MNKNKARSEQLVGFWCGQVANIVRGKLSDRFRQWGLNYSQAIILFNLGRNGTRSISQISQELGRSHPGILRQLPQLIASGLIINVEDSSDRRVHNIRLTPGGEILVAELLSVAEELNLEVIAGLDPTSVDNLIATLRAIHENFSSAHDYPPRHGPAETVTVTLPTRIA